MRKSGFRYDCEKFTIEEIKTFVENQGFHLLLVDKRPKGSLEYEVIGQDIWIEYPDPDLLKEEKVWRVYGPPCIGWFPCNDIYRDRYYARLSGDTERLREIESAYVTYHQKSKKLYDQLKRKFAIKKGEYPQSIKNQAEVEKILKEKKFLKKTSSLWPF